MLLPSSRLNFKLYCGVRTEFTLHGILNFIRRVDRLPSPKTSGFVVSIEIGVCLRIRVAALFADGVSTEIGGFFLADQASLLSR